MRYLRVYLNTCNELKLKESYNSRLQNVVTKSIASDYENINEIIRRYLSALYRVIISGNYVRVPKIDKI